MPVADEGSHLVREPVMIEHKMLEIFGGRMDAYGGDDGLAIRRPVTHQLVKNHLEGSTGIGIYPIWRSDDDRLMVKWGCCDIDTGNWDEAYSLTVALNAMNMHPHVERSRSKGWHVWVFAEKPVEARQMRRALKVAYAAIDLPAKEANPKQETLRENQLGNYVRLPFKGNLLGHTTRQVMMRDWSATGDGEPIGCRDWFYEFEHRTAVETIAHWASRWREPERTKLNTVDEIDDAEFEVLVKNLPGDLFLFVKNGPQHDRSGGLVALAFKLKAAGYSPTEIFHFVELADRRWGKYTTRVNRDEFLMDIVERVL